MATTRFPQNPTGRWLRACSGKIYGVLALIAALSPPSVSAYTPPRTSDILFSVNTDTLPASGATGNWSSFYPSGATYNQMGNPQVQTRGTVKWEKNTYGSNQGFTIWGNQSGTYTIPLNVPGDAGATQGATIVTAVKPARSGDGGNWRSIVDVMYDQLVLGVMNDTGQICVRRQGNLVFSGSGITIPNNQNTVLSLVVSANGTWKVWANGTLIWDYTATTSTFTSLAKSGLNATAIGRNNYDGWTVFNGNIGDTFMYTVALSDTDRAALETDLMAKFHAGAAYPNQTITASATGGTISPSGAVSVPYEADQTFTFAPAFGKALDVVVNGVSQGSLTSYTFNDVVAAHTIAANYTDLPTRTISGNVAAAPGGGATVSVKLAANSLASLQTTTDSSGNYTLTVPEGAYYICASQTGYVISADTVLNSTGNQTVNFTLTAGRSIPKMENLLFAADSNSLGAVGTSGSWPMLYSTYPAISSLTTINTPTVTKVRGIKYDLNQRGTGGDDGYRLNSAQATSSIPTSGATVVAVVKPIRNTLSDGWNSVVDIFRDNLILGVKNNTGQIQVRRNGTDYWSNNDAAGTLADGQLAILSLVVQPDGQFKVWCSRWNSTTNQFGAATVILSSTATSSFNAFVPAQVGPAEWRRFINIGRNNGDGWTSFNGYIGDTFVFKTALSDSDRALLETDINTKTTSIPTYSITSTAGAGGTISPAGVTEVGESDNQTYTITPAFGYDVADVSVTENGSTTSKGAVTTYTFNNVIAVGSISATFTTKPTYAVSGQVTDGTNPVAGAKVYVSSSANASFSPTYTLTTDSSGNYSVNLFNGTWYVCASATGYTTAADTTVTVSGAAQAGINFTLAASGRNIPQMDQLLFGAYGSALPGSTQPWPLEHPKGVNAAVMGTPLVTTVDGVQWEQNRYASADGYRIGSYTSAIPVNGITAIAVVQPQGDGANGGDWTSIIDVMYNRFVLGIRGTNGELVVFRNGNRRNTGVTIPNGQKTVLTALVQPDGKYKVLVNGVERVSETGASPMTSLDPTWNGGRLGFWSFINIGRNNPDGWTTYRGNIGAALLWKTVLTQNQRVNFETELGATFGIDMPVYHNITATAGTGGSISPSGVVPVAEDADQAFTITPDIGYAIQDVLVDGVSEGPTGTYTFPAVTTAHTIAATFSVVPQYTVSGTVTDQVTGLPVSGATVNFSATPNASVSPYTTATTDGSGSYSKTLYGGQLYVSVSKSGYHNTSDEALNLAGNTSGVDFGLFASTRNIPQTGQLLFSVLTEALPGSGPTGNWPTDVPVGGSLTQLNNPTVAIVDNQKWENNLRGSFQGYSVGTSSEPIPCAGATIVATVRPDRSSGDSGNWKSIVSYFHTSLGLCMRNGNGEVGVWRNGNITWAATTIPNLQKTVLSLVVQPTGQYVLYANGQSILSNTTTSDMTSIRPGTAGHEQAIFVGRGWDGWNIFNGNIGDVFVYKTALTPVERKQLEADNANKFGITLPVLHTITATAGANGVISPSGAVEVLEGAEQTFTFTPATGYSVGVVTVDGVARPGNPSNYTFTNVTEAHEISVTFVEAASDPFGNWIGFYFPSGGADAEKTADPDGDGLNNLLEYAFGTDPTDPANGPLVYTPGEAGSIAKHGQPVIVPNTLNPPYFSAVFGRRWNPSPTGLDYTVQFSADLSQWVDVVPPSGEQVPYDSEIEVVEVPFPETINPGTGPVVPKFFRVLVTETP